MRDEVWDGARLPCGQSLDDLLIQVAEPGPAAADRDREACPHCRAARAELAAIWTPVHEVASEPVHAPAELLTQIMLAVRELAREGWHAVIHTERGRTRIAARVVGAIARLAAQRVPGVALALGRGHTAGSGAHREPAADEADHAAHVAVGVAGSHVVVDVDLVVQLGAPIGAIAQAARTQVSDYLARHTGLVPHEVNIRIVDVTSVR